MSEDGIKQLQTALEGIDLKALGTDELDLLLKIACLGCYVRQLTGDVEIALDIPTHSIGVCADCLDDSERQLLTEMTQALDPQIDAALKALENGQIAKARRAVDALPDTVKVYVSRALEQGPATRGV